jgi:tetratricopeptide (TPR) repeat protein
MKRILLILALCLTAFAQTSKKTVAVYMAGKEPAAIKGAHKVLGTELAKVLTKSGEYTAVDRTEAGRKIVSAEHIFQRSGAVDPNQIKKLGKQLGVQIACIAEITEVMKSHYLEARFVDVETAEVLNIEAEPGNMEGAVDIVRTAQKVAQKLVTGEAKIYNYSFREIGLNPNMAIEDYTEAIRREPNGAEYYFKRAYAYSELKDYGRAIADYTKLIQLDPNNAMAYSHRCNSHFVLNNFDQAISDCAEAIRLEPNSSEAYSAQGVVYQGRGMAYEEKGNYDKAISNYTEFIRLENFMPQFRTNHPIVVPLMLRSRLYSKKGDYDKAIADNTKLIQLDPNNGSHFSRRGDEHSNKGDYDKAIADHTEAIRLKPNDAYYFVRRGDVYSKRGNKGDRDKAIADYESALRIDPNNFSAKYGLKKIKEEMK